MLSDKVAKMFKRLRGASAGPNQTRRRQLLGAASMLGALAWGRLALAQPQSAVTHIVKLNGAAGGPRFDGIGVVNGGGATSVLLKDYPEPQRGQILDLLYKPKFGASVSALLVEIPGDGNATQGSMLSHMHTRDDLNYQRGYMWWILTEAKRRNPRLTLDGAAWSAPGWLGDNGKLLERVGTEGDAQFFAEDTVEYYIKWLEGLRTVYGLELDAIGCRNEKGVSYAFVKALRKALNTRGFEKVKLHAFDNWPQWKLDFVKDMQSDPELRDAVDIISGHVFYANAGVPAEVQAAAKAMGKPIWNTEDHIYKKGFECLIGIVQCFNYNYIKHGVTKIVNWYDIAGVYPTEPYPEDPATVLAWEPWSGHFKVRENLWGYAHYGQFSEAGWTYLEGGSGLLAQGSYVTLKSPGEDFSVIIETKDATAAQTFRLEIGGGLSNTPLCVWRSTAQGQFERQADVTLDGGAATLTLEPNAVYSVSTTRGQRKGGFDAVPDSKPFPFPYRETFDSYAVPERHGHLPRYTADIAGAFEIVDRPDNKGRCLRQVVPKPTISWAPDWRPYTILGDAAWSDYEVGADVWLNPGDTAGVMGRINHVGTGYGFVPKGYYLELNDLGQARLIAIRGKKDPKKLIGDAEQQAQIKAGKFEGEGGELVLATAKLTKIAARRWHRLTLRFSGVTITGLVDGEVILTATNALYAKGMAGLLVGQSALAVSTPWFDNLVIAKGGGRVAPSKAPPGWSPIYGGSKA